MRFPGGRFGSFAAGILLLAVAFVGVTAASAQGGGALPLVISELRPASAPAGRRTVLTVTAAYAGSQVKIVSPVVQQVDAEGNVLRTLGKLQYKKKSRLFVGKIKLNKPPPGPLWLRIDAGKKRVRSAASPLRQLSVTGDLVRLTEIIASLPSNPQPADPSRHVLRPQALSQSILPEFESEVALAFGHDAETEFLVARSGDPSPAGIRITGNEISLSALYGDGVLAFFAKQLLDELEALGIDVEAIRSAKAMTRFNHEAELSGFLLSRTRDVKGITILRPKGLQLWAAADHVDALNRTYRLVTYKYNRIVLRGDQVASLNSGLPIETATLRLREGFSTLLHEMLHAVLHEGGWDDDTSVSEDFVHELEELYNIQVTIALKRQRGEPHADLLRQFVARLAKALRDYPKGTDYVKLIGWGLPEDQELVAQPQTLDFAVLQGDTQPPPGQAFTVDSRSLDTGALAQAAFTLTRQGPDRLVGADQILTQPDYRNGSDRCYATPRTINVSVNPTTSNDVETIPLPPGCYEDHLEIASSSAEETVRVKIRLTVFPRYTVSEIPIAGATPSGINVHGQVVGTVLQSLPGGGVQSQGFRWSRAAGVSWLEVGSSATGVNDAGTIIGNATFPQPDETFKRLGCTWTGNGAASQLPGPNDPFSQLQPWAINNAGEIVGRIPLGSTGALRAALWQGGGPTDLGTLGNPGGNPQNGWSEAFGINAEGVIVGVSTTASGEIRAFVRRNGVMTDLGGSPDLVGWDFYGVGISSNGVVVGNARTSIGSAAFYWKDENGNGLSDPGELQRVAPRLSWSQVQAINSEGWFIGSMLLSSLRFAPYLSCGGTVMDLDALIPAGSGWVLSSATAINSRGDIVGLGTNGGRSAAFLLERVP
ncbi:MAG: hypothetical protein ACO1SX_02505 [Actinomycetota bacterium]